MKCRIITVGALLASLWLVRPVTASFHEINVVEIFPGSSAAPTSQYVVLQMSTAGQNLVGGHSLTVYDATGALVETATFAADVANGANQSRILIATTDAQTSFGVSADLLMNPVLSPTAGKVCWDTVDCVSWGAFQGNAYNPSPSGTPFGPNGGILIGHAIRRDISHGNPSTLQGGDDTDDSFEDFDCAATAMPINNAGASGTYTDAVPCPVCGNNSTETGEVCDGTDDAACPGGCTDACLCPVHDSVVLPLKPLKLTVSTEAPMSVSKNIKIKVINADTHKFSDDIKLTASLGDCPPGVSVTTPDFTPPTMNDTVKLAAEDSASAVATVTVTAAAFSTFNRKSPARCTLQFTASTDIAGNSDPRPSNNVVPLEINVFDKNDTEQSSPPHQSYLASLKPLKVSIPPGAGSKAKKVKPTVGNADVLPAPDAGDSIAVTVDVSSCTGVSVDSLDMNKESDGNQSSTLVDGGKTAKGLLVISADASLSTPTSKTPQRCIATLTAVGPSDPDTDPSNNSARLVIDIVDKNDVP